LMEMLQESYKTVNIYDTCSKQQIGTPLASRSSLINRQFAANF